MTDVLQFVLFGPDQFLVCKEVFYYLVFLLARKCFCRNGRTTDKQLLMMFIIDTRFLGRKPLTMWSERRISLARLFVANACRAFLTICSEPVATRTRTKCTDFVTRLMETNTSYSESTDYWGSNRVSRSATNYKSHSPANQLLIYRKPIYGSHRSWLGLKMSNRVKPPTSRHCTLHRFVFGKSRHFTENFSTSRCAAVQQHYISPLSFPSSV